MMKKKLMLLLTMAGVVETQASDQLDKFLIATTLAGASLVVGTVGYNLYDLYDTSKTDAQILVLTQKKLDKFSQYKEMFDLPPLPDVEGVESTTRRKPFYGMENLLESNLMRLGVSTYAVNENFTKKIESDIAELNESSCMTMYLRSWFNNDMNGPLQQMHQYQSNAKDMLAFFSMHPNYIKGLTILNFYRNLPVKEEFSFTSKEDQLEQLHTWVRQQIQVLVEQKIVTEQQYPISFYMTKVQNDCAWIDQFSSMDSPLPAHLVPTASGVASSPVVSNNLRKGLVSSLQDRAEKLEVSVDKLAFRAIKKKIETNPKLYPQMVAALVARKDAIEKSSKDVMNSRYYLTELQAQVVDDSKEKYDAYLAQAQENLEKCDQGWVSRK